MDEKVLFRTESREIYSTSEMKNIEKVIRTFYNYLRDSRRCELLWSDKVGYILIPINRVKSAPPTGPWVIQGAGDLVSALLREISKDVSGTEKEKRLSRKERVEFQRRIQDYMTQLPEYQDCMPKGLRFAVKNGAYVI